MRGGELDRRVRIQRKVERRTRRGERVERWVDIAVVWAGVQAAPSPRPEQFQEDQFIAKDRRVFRIRYRSDVDATCRLVYEDRPWDILSAPEIGRREGLRIVAEARGD